MGTNYIAPIWRMPRNANNTPVDKLSNYSIDFDGSVKNINLPTTWVDDIGLTSAKKLSFSIWVKPDSTSTRMTVTSSPYNTWNDNFGINYLASSTQLWLEQGASTKFLSTSTTLTANEWSHLLFVFDASESSASTKTKCYINGDLVTNESSTIFTSMTNPGNAFYFGRLYYGAGSSNYSWSGNLGQACFFDYALSTDQITYLYNLNNPMAITGAEPVAYWPLGDNSNPNADAGYPNTSVGSDSVFEFNSAGTRIDLGLESSLSLGDASKYSTSLWFKKSGNTTNCLWGYNYGDANGSGWYYWLNSGNLRISTGKNGISSGFGTYDISASELPVGKWQHIVVVFNGTLSAGDDRIKVYHNGANAVGTYSNSANFPATLPNGNGASNRNVYLGQLQLGNGSFSYNYDGELSNVQQWSTDLSLSDAETLYNNGQPIMTGTQPEAANLKAWYKLNQSADWDLFGQSKWTIQDSASPYTKSFSLDSVNPPTDYFNTSIGPRGMTTNVGTYSCWINLNSVAGQQVFMDVAGFASREYLGLKIRNNNALQMIMGSWSTQMLWDSVTTTPFEVGKWYHVVAVGDGTNIRMYINGEEISTYIASGSYRWWSNFNTSIAHNGGYKIHLAAGVYPTRNSPLNGRISNAQIWNTNLSSSQIETLYNNGKPLQGTQPAQENLLAWYKLNQDSTWTNYNYWNNVLVNKWSSKNSAITTTPPAESFGFSGYAQDGDFEGWEVTNKSISGSLLLSFWYKTTGDQVFTWTFNNDGSGNTNAGKARMQGNGYIYFFSPNGSNYFSRNNTNIADYNWHNLIIYIPNGSPTYDANDINMWQDGVELGKPSFVGSTTWDAFTEIKGMNRNSSSSNNGTGTQWSNWALFENVTPSDSVIDTIFNGGTPGDISSLNPSIWYKLDNTDTTFATTGSKATALSITDSSSNNNDATGPYDYDAAVSSRPVLINGDVQNAIAGYYMDGSELKNFSVSALNGKSSGMNTTNIVQSNLTRKVPYSSYSTSFLGTTDYFTSTPSIGITNAITISAWVKIPTTNTTITLPQQIICEDNTSGTERNWLLYYRNQGGTNNHFIFVVFHTDGSSTSITSSGITPNNGLWQHVVGTFDGTTNANGFKLYVNGQQAATPVTASSTGVRSTSGVGPSIGALEHGLWPIDAHISNCAVWEAAITQDDVLNLYNNGTTQDLNNFRLTPYAWWPLDENSTYFNGSVLVARDLINAKDVTGVNLVQSNIHGTAPGSEASGTGNNLTIADLKGNMYNSDKNAYSINMADYADGVTNPANSGRSTDTPS